MIFKASCFVGLVFIFGCSSRPVVMHPSHTPPPPKAKPAVKNIPAKITPPVALIQPPPETPKKPVVEIKNNKAESALVELKKNIANLSVAESIIDNRLSLAELESASTDSAFVSLKPQLLLKLGKTYQKNQDLDKASTYFRAVTAMYPQTASGVQANTLLASIQIMNDADPKVVGAILPLTGKNASIGQHALNAIRIGLEMQKPESKFRVAIFDSQSDPDLAAKGVDKLVKEDKVIALMGGFSSKEATTIATRAELYMTPFFGFSQKSGLTNVGDFVFRNAVTPEMQVDTLVQFAFDKLHARKFAVLFPNDSYGVEFSNIYWDHVLARGGQITAAQTYDPKENDFSEVVQKMTGLYYPEARREEYQELLEEKQQTHKKNAAKAAAGGTAPKTVRSSRDSWSEESILPPIVDFDVLFIPDNSKALGQVLAFMKYYDVTNMNYLGTNIWGSPDLPKRVANEKGAVYFVDSLDLVGDTSAASPFFKEYLAQFNEEPTLVEVQAFEAAKILREQISSGATTRQALANALRSLGRSQGVTGELRMSTQRELERPLRILTLDSGIIKKTE